LQTWIKAWVWEPSGQLFFLESAHFPILRCCIQCALPQKICSCEVSSGSFLNSFSDKTKNLWPLELLTYSKQQDLPCQKAQPILCLLDRVVCGEIAFFFLKKRTVFICNCHYIKIDSDWLCFFLIFSSAKLSLLTILRST
jgi:hypothetical protein